MRQGRWDHGTLTLWLALPYNGVGKDDLRCGFRLDWQRKPYASVVRVLRGSVGDLPDERMNKDVRALDPQELRQSLMSGHQAGEEKGEEQLRAFAQWLLVVPLVMVMLLGCGQLALVTANHLRFPALAVSAAEGYGPWDYLPLKAVRDDILAELGLDKGVRPALVDLGDGEEQGGWLAEAASPTAPLTGVDPPATATPTQAGGDIPRPTATQASSGGSNPTPTATSNSTQSVPIYTPTATPAFDYQPTATPSAIPSPTATSGSKPPPDPYPPGEWWSAQFAYRVPITISAGAKGVPAGYTVALTFNHAGLVSQGKSRADGNDVRVLWQSPSGWVELDRVLDDDSTWSQSSTTVHFAIREAIGANSSDSRYYLYYGNPSAGTPPTNLNNVYWYASTFDSDAALADWTAYDVKDWTNWRIKDGMLVQYRNAKQDDQLPFINGKLLLTARGPIRDLEVEVDFKVGDNDLLAVGLCSADTNPQGFYLAASQDRWFDSNDGPDQVGYWISADKFTSRRVDYSQDRWYELVVRWTDSMIGVTMNGHSFGWDVGPAQGDYFCLALNALEGVSFDNLFIRLYVDPEPTLSLGVEEMAP